MPSEAGLKRYALSENLQRKIDPLTRPRKLDFLGNLMFASRLVTPEKKAVLREFIREGREQYVEELVARSNTPQRRQILPYLLHAMAVSPGKLATALKQVGYDHNAIATKLFYLPRVRQIETSRGKTPRFNEMINEGRKIILALQEAGFKKHTEIAEALHRVRFQPGQIAGDMFKTGYTPMQIAAGLKGLSEVDTGKALYASVVKRGTNRKKLRAVSVVSAALNKAGFKPVEIAKTLKTQGHSAREVAFHLRENGVKASSGFADALHGAGYSSEEIASTMVASEYNAKDVAKEINRLSPTDTSDAIYTALTREKYTGKGSEQALLNELSAALKNVGFTPSKIAADFNNLGHSGNKIAASLRAVGYSPIQVADAFQKNGRTDFQVASNMFGAFNIEQVSNALFANGSKDIPAAIHAVLRIKYPASSRSARLCQDLASALKSIGYDHHRITSALMNLNYDGKVIVSALRVNGFKPLEIATALYDVKYNSDDIAHYMLSSDYSPVQVATELDRLPLSNIGAALNDALVKKYGPNKPEQTSAIIADALKKLNFSNFAIASSLADAGHDHNIVAASLKSIGIDNAHELSESLYHVKFSHAQVAEALLSNKFSPVDVAVELYARGATYGAIQRGLTNGKFSGVQINNALKAIGFEG